MDETKDPIVEAMKIEFGLLTLKPGDTLVAMIDARLSAAGIKDFTEAMEGQFPGHKCLLLADGVKLGVVRNEATSEPKRRGREFL